MNNWKDYVAYQPLDDEGLPLGYYTLVYTVTTNANGSTNVSPHIDRVAIDLSEMTLTEDEVGQAVEDVLTTFPTQEIKSIVDLQRAKNNVALTTRHAVPETNFNGAWYFNGSAIDSAIYVIGYKGQYAVKKHVNFDDYGFVVASAPPAPEQPAKYIEL